MHIRINVPSLPLAANICEQMLREVCRNERWSMAHVVMNPGAFSLLHEHRKMAEVYVITRGFGELVVGKQSLGVRAGAVVKIPANMPHRFFNVGATSLEHLVLATPAFNPWDVFVAENQGWRHSVSQAFLMPDPVECFDGARIMPYDFPELDLSFAFGWVINGPKRHKVAHFHKQITEYLYIIEGKGVVELDGKELPVEPGDWVEIPPGVSHAIRNKYDQYMVVLCMCSPRFSMDDVHYS